MACSEPQQTDFGRPGLKMDLKLGPSTQLIIMLGYYFASLLKGITATPRSCRHRDLQCSLRGKKITVAYSQVVPYLSLTNETARRTNRANRIRINPKNVHDVGLQVAGLEAELLRTLCKQYGIEFDLRMYEFYGNILGNGTWTGKFAPLAAEEVDMVAGCVPGHYKRNQIGRHSAAMYYYQFRIVSVKENVGGLAHILAPLLPFQWIVWVGIAVSLLAVGSCVWLLTLMHARLWRRPSPTSLSFLKVIGHVVRVLIGTTGENWRWLTKVSAKLLVGIWLLTLLILQCSYSSKLIVSYSMRWNPESPETMEDIVRMGKTAVVADGGTPLAITQRYGKHIKTKVLSRQVFPRYLTDSSTVTMYDPHSYIFKILEDGRRPLNDFHFSKIPVVSMFTGWLYSPRFENVEEFNLFILRAAQSGLLDKWRDDQFRKLRKYTEILEGRENEVEFSNATLKLEKLQAAFTLWAVGILLGTVAFVAEILIGRYCGFHRKRSLPHRETTVTN